MCRTILRKIQNSSVKYQNVYQKPISLSFPKRRFYQRILLQTYYIPAKKADQRFRQFLFSPQLSQIITYKNKIDYNS